MKHRRPFIVRHQQALQECTREVIGLNKPANVKGVLTQVQDVRPPFHFVAYAEVGEELYRRVYVEYDERLTSLQHDLIDYKVAFVREGRLLGDTQWQHHRFSIAGHNPAAAACVLTSHMRQFFMDLTVPRHDQLSVPLFALT